VDEYGRAGQATEENMAYAINSPSDYDNSYCFSTATMVARNRLNVMLPYVACVVLVNKGELKVVSQKIT
jgi:hypothetical protein